MIVIPKKTFLFKQEELEGGKKKDILARKGEKIEMSESEAVKFYGGLQLTDTQKKKLNTIARLNKYTRVI